MTGIDSFAPCKTKRDERNTQNSFDGEKLEKSLIQDRNSSKYLTEQDPISVKDYIKSLNTTH